MTLRRMAHRFILALGLIITATVTAILDMRTDILITIMATMVTDITVAGIPAMAITGIGGKRSGPLKEPRPKRTFRPFLFPPRSVPETGDRHSLPTIALTRQLGEASSSAAF